MSGKKLPFLDAMSKRKLAELYFTESLMHWHLNDNKRQMPWKEEKDPYKIWLSEIILQQTRVEQGLAYYLKFVENYPDVKSLAAAEDAQVFKLWEGLGYYSRCRNLLAAARQVVYNHEGVFPATYEQILSLKGIGPYTAAAISSFGFGLANAVVDGNVIRVLSRYFGIATAFDSTEGKKQFAQLAQQLLDKENPAYYNQAIMDFGATVCKPALPLCNNCMLQAHCVAYSVGKVDELPVRSKKITRKTRWLCYWVIRHGNKILIRERLGKDIWQHLHEFYLIEDAAAFEWDDQQIQIEAYKKWGIEVTVRKKSAIYTQQLTHQTIHARFIELEIQAGIEFEGDYKWVSAKAAKALAFPKVINEFLNGNSKNTILLF